MPTSLLCVPCSIISSFSLSLSLFCVCVCFFYSSLSRYISQFATTKNSHLTEPRTSQMISSTGIRLAAHSHQVWVYIYVFIIIAITPRNPKKKHSRSGVYTDRERTAGARSWHGGWRGTEAPAESSACVHTASPHYMCVIGYPARAAPRAACIVRRAVLFVRCIRLCCLGCGGFLFFFFSFCVLGFEKVG